MAEPAAQGAALSVDRFWQLVDGTLDADPNRQASLLGPRLRALSGEDLAGFHRRYVQLANDIATAPHFSAAAEVVMGFVSQDVFVDFRTWIVFQGRQRYESFRADPDSLAEWGLSDDEQLGAAEILEYLPQEVGGGSPDWANDGPSVYIEPTGNVEDVPYSTLRQRFPRLAHIYLPPNEAASTPTQEGPREVRRWH